MIMNPVIKPNVMNILCSDPAPAQRGRFQSQPQPEQKQRTFRSKFGGLIKKVATVIVSALTILPPVLNAISRFKAAFKLDNRRCDNVKCSYS